jgi:hypothetical protein
MFRLDTLNRQWPFIFIGGRSIRLNPSRATIKTDSKFDLDSQIKLTQT